MRVEVAFAQRRPLMDGLSQAEQIAAQKVLLQAPAAADIAMDYLARCLTQSAVANRVYARRHRLKTLDGIAEKVVRKRRDPKRKGEPYDWTAITDIIGLRFVTLYRADIAAVAECILLALLAKNTAVTPCPFQRSGLAEFKYYLANAVASEDAIGLMLRRMSDEYRLEADAWDFEGPIIGDRYSSIHFVVWVEHNQERVPIEIQIRSVYEDAWGEVDHALIYERTRQLSSSPPEGEIRSYSQAFKKMMDAAADFADVMRAIASPPRGPVSTIKPTPDDTAYAKELCAALSVPASVANKLYDLLDRKQQLVSALKSGDGSKTSLDYGVLVTDLSGFLKEQLRPGAFLEGKPTGGETRAFYYMVRLEEAVCRLLTQMEAQTPIAVAQLSDLTEEFPNNPAAWLRLGEAAAAAFEITDDTKARAHAAKTGLDAYVKARETYEAHGKLDEAQKLLAASPVQMDYIRDNLGRLHAFLAWRVASKRRASGSTTKNALTAARVAFKLVYERMADVQDVTARRRALNNVVYFGAEILEFALKLGVAPELPCAADDLREFVKELEQTAPKNPKDPSSLSFWDSVAYLRSGLGDVQEAKGAATRVLVALQEFMRGIPGARPTLYLQEQAAIAMERALRIQELHI